MPLVFAPLVALSSFCPSSPCLLPTLHHLVVFLPLIASSSCIFAHLVVFPSLCTLSPPHAPPHEDATMASEPIHYLCLHNLLPSTSANNVLSTPSELTPAAKTKEQLQWHYIRMLHNVIDKSDVAVPILDAHDPAGCHSQLVGGEVVDIIGMQIMLILRFGATQECPGLVQTPHPRSSFALRAHIIR